MLWPNVLEILELLTRVNFLMYLYTASNLEIEMSFFFVHVRLTLGISAIYRTQKRQAMQAFLKGATVQTTKIQKEKTLAGSSTEKKARAVPWVEK